MIRKAKAVWPGRALSQGCHAAQPGGRVMLIKTGRTCSSTWPRSRISIRQSKLGLRLSLPFSHSIGGGCSVDKTRTLRRLQGSRGGHRTAALHLRCSRR